MKVKDLYNKTITILNKLDRRDSLTGLDVWHKFIIKNVAYYSEKVSNVSGNNVSIGQTFKIEITFNSLYKNYSDWKKSGNQNCCFTVSAGDYIVFENIEEDAITPNNIQAIKNKYEPNVCEVRAFKELDKRKSNYVMLEIEGV